MSETDVKKTSNIVITGGYGFLGNSIVNKLKESGYENVNTFKSVEFDLVNQSQCDKMFFYYNPEIIIHLAARVGGIGANMKNPGKFCYDNLAMGINVLECARKYKCQKVVTAGTICAYPHTTPIPFKEENLWSGYPEPTNAPYGTAKKMLLVMSQAYRQQYGNNFIYLLPVNLFGPRDSFHLENSHVIPAMIRKFHEAKERNDKEVTLWGDGSPTREFLYVDDCADAFISAMENYNKPEPINLGSGREIHMKDLANIIKDTVDYNGNIIWDTTKPNGQPRRCLDVSRAKNLLKWESSTSLESGIQKTYEWFCKQEK